MLGVGNDCLMPLYIKQDSSKFLFPGKNDRSGYLRVRCGHCINCKVHRANEWSIRLEMEARCWKDICFVTLTYNDESLPYTHVDEYEFAKARLERRINEIYRPYIPTCVADDISDFIKRLRKRAGTSQRLKYFGCCEYGTRFGRPHIHLLIFGLSKNPVTEKLVDLSWNFNGVQRGFVRVDPFHGVGTCKYIAGYILKKLYAYDEKDPLLYQFRLREQSRQSLHLGEEFFFSHLEDLQISPTHPYIDYEGVKVSIPRTFHRKLTKMGILPKLPLDMYYDMQIKDLLNLSAFCEQNHCTLSEYFANRRKIAHAKYKRKTNKRDVTGDI